MIRVSDPANTRETDDAATQRNTLFVKFRKFVQRPFLQHPSFQHPHVQRLHSAFSNVSRIRALRSAALIALIITGAIGALPPRANATIPAQVAQMAKLFKLADIFQMAAQPAAFSQVPHPSKAAQRNIGFVKSRMQREQPEFIKSRKCPK